MPTEGQVKLNLPGLHHGDKFFKGLGKKMELQMEKYIIYTQIMIEEKKTTHWKIWQE